MGRRALCRRAGSRRNSRQSRHRCKRFLGAGGWIPCGSNKAYLDNLGPAGAETFQRLTDHARQSGQIFGCRYALLTELVLINEPRG